jgi:hypothetical protein
MKRTKKAETVYQFETFPIIDGMKNTFGMWSTFSFSSLRKAKAERDRIIEARRQAGRTTLEIPVYRIVRTLVKETS